MIEIGFACQARKQVSPARQAAPSSRLPSATLPALAFPDQAGFAGARGTGGDVTFRYGWAAA
jgi:hypothetical protein